MTNPLYGYNVNYGGSGLSSTYYSGLMGSITNSYDSSQYMNSDTIMETDPSESLFLNQSDNLRMHGGEIDSKHMLVQSSWTSSAGSAENLGFKRSNEALYNQSVLGTNNSIDQSRALFFINSLSKRPRFENGRNLPIYPQRPGEKDCAHYMLTRTCKFGYSCKFDHPMWVPDGGLPDWKEVLIPCGESFPERPGEPDCPHFVKTRTCKYGHRCKFNHPKDISSGGTINNGAIAIDNSILPDRPSEPSCAFYMKTGACMFGSTCKFHHPKHIQTAVITQDSAGGMQCDSTSEDDGTGEVKSTKTLIPFSPASLHNSKGLPIRVGEADCPFYLKMGSCKFGAICRFNHPERTAFTPPLAGALGLINSQTANLSLGVINPASSLLPNVGVCLTHSGHEMAATTYPQRPGEMECNHYMKTGVCKFGEWCKFHHPLDRMLPTTSSSNLSLQQNINLTLAGFPRREGAIICNYYLKTGTCKFGVTCKFDHPPPGELVANALTQEGDVS